MNTTTYSGPKFCIVRSADEFSHSVYDSDNKRVGTYPTHTLAERVVKLKNQAFLRDYLRAQRKVAK